MLNKVRLGGRKRTMKKTTIIWLISGLILLVVSYLFRGYSRLIDIQNWLNNSGLATLFGIVIPLWVYFAVYFWNQKKEKTPEYKEYEKLLLSDIHKLENIQVAPYREVSLINWWKQNYDRLTLNFWEARYSGDWLIVESDLTKSLVWSYLEKHLVKSKLQILLNEWELAMKDDLLARKCLFDSVLSRVRESVQLVFKMPITEYTYLNWTTEKKYDKPYITDYFAAAIYDYLFCSLSGNPIRNPKDYLKHEPEGEISWDSAGTRWLLLSNDDTKQRDEAIGLLLKLANDLIGLPEIQKAKDSYFEAINKAQQLNVMAKITTNLPRGKRCDFCKTL